MPQSNDKYEEIKSRIRSEMQRAALTDSMPATARKTANYRREHEKTSDEKEVAVQETAAYKILTNEKLTPEQKIDQLAELLTFNENELDMMVQFINEDRAIVAQLLANFTSHNRQSIELVRDNPLSKLRAGIADVFADYHNLTKGRADLRDKLILVDELIARYGGAKELVDAMLAAKDKEGEYLAKKAASVKASDGLKEIRAVIERKNAHAAMDRQEITENSGDFLIAFKPSKKRRLNRAKESLASNLKAIDDAKAAEASQIPISEEAAKALAEFMQTEDWKVNEKILAILNIGGQEFIQRVKDLSNITLSYIDKTEEVLTGARDQLESLLKRTILIHSLTHNTKESVAIMLEAHQKAQDKNTAILRQLETQENLEGLDKLEHDKKKRALHQHISALDKQAQSTTAVAAELGKIESSLTNFKDQMEEGLADATEQQMLAVSSAAVTGNNTLMRIEGLATFVQSVISKGQYYKESEQALGELAKEMERALMGRLAKNQNIKDVTDVLHEMTTALDNKNDVVLEIAEERKALIDRLLKQANELGKANEDALAVDANVNKRLYVDAKDDGSNG